MSVESAGQLIVKLGTDAAFREQIERAAPAERKALLESHGFGDVTRADVEAAKVRNGELSGVELESVAGGCWYDPIPIFDPSEPILY
jgi:predicted ribosomally synthesized peptide with nif11-like leader